MKKVYLLISILSLLILGGCTYVDSLEQRVRIIGNSDNPVDLQKKYAVREALLDIFYEESILVNKDTVTLIEQKLQERTKDLNVKLVVEYKKVTFPAKLQKGKMLPSGTYTTLLITIDEGKGSNWWSVLYPEFFGLNYGDAGELEYRSFIYDLLN